MQQQQRERGWSFNLGSSAQQQQQQQQQQRRAGGWSFNFGDLLCLGDRGKGTAVAAGRPLPQALQNFCICLPQPFDRASAVRTQIKLYGGRIVPSIEGATHVIVRPGLRESDLSSDPALHRMLVRCQTISIGVVEPSWLDAIGALQDTNGTGGVAGHSDEWAAAAASSLVDDHVPPIMALLDSVEALEARDGNTPGGGVTTAGAATMGGDPCGVKREKREGSADPADREGVARGSAAERRDGKRAAVRPGLNASLGETWQFLRATHPAEVEADLLARAIERSMLDFAVQLRHASPTEPLAPLEPHAVLGVPRDATADTVRAAYRRRALATHPDRGGSPAQFLQVQHAYRRLAEAAEGHTGHSDGGGGGGGGGSVLPPASLPRLGLLTAPRVDAELSEHRALVEAWLERDGDQLQQSRRALEAATDAAGLRALEVGSTNRNERGEMMYNQCFCACCERTRLTGLPFIPCPLPSHHASLPTLPHLHTLRISDLSLARAFVADGSAHEPARPVLEATALHFKRVVEAAVLRAHPEWAETQARSPLVSRCVCTASRAVSARAASRVFVAVCVYVYVCAHVSVHARSRHLFSRVSGRTRHTPSPHLLSRVRL